MKRLIKENGMAMNKVNNMPGDTVKVYHGTGAQNIDNIKQSGLTENVDNSYQMNGANYGAGIWVTLNEQAAKGYAIDSAKGFMKDNEGSQDEEITQYFGYGAIFEFEVSKDSLNDEGSASVNNLKSNETITPDKIKNVYVFDINSGQQWVANSNRLIKKISKAFGDVSKYGQDFIIYKNPTKDEVRLSKLEDMMGQVRGIIDNDGTEYCWCGSLVHDDVKNVANFNSFHFAYCDSYGWSCDAVSLYTKNEFIDKILKYKDILKRYGDLNNTWLIGNFKDNGEQIECQGIDQLTNFIDDEAKLAKIAYHTNPKTKAWVDDRVKTLLEHNPEMDESMAYGIAWKQFKKKHPNWEPKKTAEFLDSYSTLDNFGGKMEVEIFINPTSREIGDCKKNRYKAIRGVIDGATEYCWRGDILHDKVKGVNVDCFRFGFEGNSGSKPIWIFDAHGKYTLLELCKLVRDNANVLSKYGDINAEMFLCYTSDGLASDFSDDHQDLKTINQYINEHETEKVSRLLKKAEYVHCHSCGWDNGDFMYDNDGNLQSWVPDKSTKKFKAMEKDQIYKSRKEYDKKNPERICPKCSKQDLDTD